MLFNFLFFNLFVHIIVFAWKRYENSNLFYKLSIVSIIIALILSIFDIYMSKDGQSILLFNNNLRTNQVIFAQQFFITFITFILILSYKEFKFKPEFYVLLFTNLFAICLILESNNFVIFFISWELFNLSLYAIIIGNNVNTQEALSASMKYFILSAFSTTFLLLGLAILYHITGSLEFQTIYITMSERPIDIAVVFIIFALLFKLSAAPLHFWAPDLYSITPLPITAYISNVPKILYIMIAQNYMIFLECQSNYFLIAGFLSLIIGTIGLTQQTKIKRFLAFSAIANVGYLLLIIKSDGLVIYNLVLYIIAVINIFIILMAVNKFFDKDIDNIAELQGFFIFNPFMAFSFTISLFSIAGIPPLPGFFAKYNLLSEALDIFHPILFIIIVITSVIAVANYLRIIYLAIFSVYKLDKLRKKDNNLVLNIIVQFNLIIMGLLSYLDILSSFLNALGYAF